MLFWDWLNDNAGAASVIVSATGVVMAALSRALRKLGGLLLALAAVALLAGAGVAGFAFAPSEKYGAPTIEIGTAPPCLVVTEASETTYAVGGRVRGVLNPRRMKLVLYAHAADQWYVQPLVSAPFTDIHTDGAFQSETHAGDRYMALLVTPKYRPVAVTQTLASPGDDVIAALSIACVP